jgi:hypothetical protein
VELNNQAKLAEKDTKLSETAAALREMRDMAEMERSRMMAELAKAKEKGKRRTV